MKRQIRVLCALLLIVAALAAFLLVPGAASPVMIVPAATRSLAQRAASAVARLTNWMPVDYAAKNDSMHIELLRLATEGGIDLAHDPGNRVVSVESGSPESVDVPCRAAFDEPRLARVAVELHQIDPRRAFDAPRPHIIVQHGERVCHARAARERFLQKRRRQPRRH